MAEPKMTALAALEPDVVVLAEVQPAFDPPAGWTILRRDGERARDLAVLVRPGWVLSVCSRDPGLPWLLPCEVSGPAGGALTVLGIWTVEGAGHGSYAAQARAAVAARERAAPGRGPWRSTVLAGDLNAPTSASAPAHDRTLAALREVGMVSAYHHTAGVEHGQEPDPTLRWTGRGGLVSLFHCDYVFVSSDLLPGAVCRTGPAAEWLGKGRSDHLPLVADLRLPDLATGR